MCDLGGCSGKVKQSQQLEMETDLNTTLAVSLIQTKPIGMDIVDYIDGVQSKIMEKENELFFQEFLHDSELNKSLDQQSIKEDVSPSFFNVQSFERSYNNNVSPEKNKFYSEMSSASTSNIIKKSNSCLVQPVITMKTLNETTKIAIDSGYETYNWNINFQDTSKRPVEIMSQSIQEALDLFMITLFDCSKLMDVVINWDDCNNLVRYFANLVTSMAKNIEFGFTCRNHIMTFIQNTVFKILDDHHLYNSIHVEYQCNLLAKFCYDKYIRWSIIQLLINRLKIDIQIVPSSKSLRSIFYTFHFIDKLLYNIDFYDTITTTENKKSLTDMWKVNHTNKSDNETETMGKMLKEWITELEYISMEALKKNVFLVSIRANQCLESLKLITFD